MRVWRIARQVHSVLDGEGARRAGGRWNAPGTPVVYASSSLSLAALELLVHTDPDLVPDDLNAFEIEIPDDLTVGVVDVRSLPTDWRGIPNHPACRTTGDNWVARRRYAVLGVPSAVVPEELNCLINPAHRNAVRIGVVRSRAFALDERLL